MTSMRPIPRAPLPVAGAAPRRRRPAATCSALSRGDDGTGEFRFNEVTERRLCFFLVVVARKWRNSFFFLSSIEKKRKNEARSDGC